MSPLLTGLGPLGWAILDSSPEGILVADEEGTILYANEAYTRICRRDGQERVGTNILLTNPHGALAQALRTGRPVYGNKHRPPGSQTDVVAHAFPIYLNDKLVGGVVFFQEAGEALELLEQLARAQESLAILSTKMESMGKAPYTFASIVGRSRCLQEALATARKAATTDSTVLLRGESGTGKELFAAAIHNASRRARQPFVHVNCAAIPDTLLESEFFGYEKGSFTGATQRKLGTFELADRGTIFLDEIGDMDLRLQAKVLQVLQSGEFRRVGGTTTIKVNVRVIAATNRNLEQLMDKGQFREDLYFRLNVVEINVPPLRERKEDIPLLVDHLLEKIGRKIGKRVAGITEEALVLLEQYCWPGNVRELENVLERALALAEEGQPVTAADIFLPRPRQAGQEELISLAEMERVMIEKALAKFGTSVQGKREAARALGISLSTLYDKLKRTGKETTGAPQSARTFRKSEKPSE
ncbi:MAG: sigma 54-interacting transcriptional regulator [Moorella sp. (in: Bacteria)]|nr:sigma 54-interacting transcriptional regulator [Moorella sp. (in: firmicutes)]